MILKACGRKLPCSHKHFQGTSYTNVPGEGPGGTRSVGGSGDLSSPTSLGWCANLPVCRRPCTAHMASPPFFPHMYRQQPTPQKLPLRNVCLLAGRGCPEPWHCAHEACTVSMRTRSLAISIPPLHLPSGPSNLPPTSIQTNIWSRSRTRTRWDATKVCIPTPSPAHELSARP